MGLRGAWMPGTGARIAQALAEGAPIVGTKLSWFKPEENEPQPGNRVGEDTSSHLWIPGDEAIQCASISVTPGLWAQSWWVQWENAGMQDFSLSDISSRPDKLWCDLDLQSQDTFSEHWLMVPCDKYDPF